MIFYNPNGNTLLDVAVNDNSYRYREIMGDNNLTVYFALAEHVEIPVGAYTDFQGERYTLQRPEALKMHHTRYFEYTVTLESSQAKAKIWKFRNPVDGRLKFSLTARPHEHLQMFVDNMNRRDTGWTVGECIGGTEQCVSYDHAFCWDALGQMADTFNTEFEIVGKVVSLHKVEYFKTSPLPLSYGKGNGFKTGVERTNYGDNPPCEILYAQGGTDNIDYSKYGSSELHLPKNGQIAYDGTHFEDEDGFDSKNARKYIADDKGYSVRRLDKDLSSLAEQSLDCSDVYPKRIGKVVEVVTVNAEDNFYDIIDTTIPDTLNFEDCLIEGETMTIIFQTGMLAGKEFEVKYYHTATTKKKGKRFEIVPQEIDGQTMPNDTFKPDIDDTYAVFHCYLPDAYINAHKEDSDPKDGAEWDMMRMAVKYLYENEDTNFTFTGTLDGIYARKNWTNIGGKIVLGGYILFTDARFQKDGVRIRIKSIKDYINKPYSPEIEISNSTVTGSFSTTIQEITSSEVITEDYHREALQFTKRRFRDAKESLSMLEEALLSNFTNSITPISVQTMAMLVGDESLQFRFVNSKTTPTAVDSGITYYQDTKQLHCPAAIIQHMTLGIGSVSSEHDISEYRFWDMEEYLSGRLDDTEAQYYLYAVVSRTQDTGTFLLSQTAKKMNADSGSYYMLVGLLNSEYDGERSFVTLYGFTEILPGRITTDKIVSGDGLSYFDLVANAMRLGDMLDFNTNGDGQLRLKGTIVQSQSGDEEYIGCFRGAYNEAFTYYQGDEVTYEIDECTSTYRFISSTPAVGIAPTDTDYWQVIAQGSEGKAGVDGISPNTAFKSVVFKRSNTTPSRPTGGSYASPVPSLWSDGVPIGEAKLWCSTRIFSSDGKSPQQSFWSYPRQMTDTADFDVEFSSVASPSAPTGHPNTNTEWSDEATEETIWMATARKSNGVWDDWQVSRIKGENGQDGTSVSIKGEAYEHYSSEAALKASVYSSGVKYLVDGTTNGAMIWTYYGHGWGTVYAADGDGYIMFGTGHLWVASGNVWTDAGQIKGDTGATGEDGKNAYVHIKYADSLAEDDWSDNDGETPAAYIGIYCDNNPVDQLDWSLYTWHKWQGEDGFGYEYIYKRTSSATAPSTPTDISQEDGFVPDGWTDDPTGVDSTNMYEWVVYRKKTDGVWGAFVGSAADNSVAALWAKYGQTGATGQTGAYYEVRFARNGSTTTPPTLNRSTANPSGWSTYQPTVGTGQYLWMTTCKKSSANVMMSAWSTPTRINGKDGADGEDGDDGKSPVMLYRGTYDASKTYYGNENRLDCVSLNGAYYIARIDAETFLGVAPPDTTKWNAFGASFDSVATSLLLADLANIAGFIFRNSRLESQTLADGTVTDGASSKTPMVYLNGKTGEVSLAGGRARFNSDGSVTLADGKVKIDTSGNVTMNNVTMSNIIANSGTFKGTIYATQGIVYNVRKITTNNQTLNNSDAFVVVSYNRTTVNDYGIVNFPRNPNNGQIITIKNVSIHSIGGYETIYMYGNGHKICPGSSILMGNIEPYDGGLYMYVKFGRAQQFIFDGETWQQVGQYEW